ncbi:hypothetical protein MNV49_005613 [Pseudohyphozyma bogoriensis]|nr:hypothetical protein MNV49_005613 [Pseudohyphozyma bogoriensis]
MHQRRQSMNVNSFTPPPPVVEVQFTNGASSSPPSKPGEHARKHSRIHERNLSAFFPRPGQEPGVGYGDTYDDPNGSGQVGGVTDIPSASAPYGRQAVRGPGTGEAAGGDSGKTTAGRRGHHHRHSLSHAHFSFLDPTSTSHVDLKSPTLPTSPFASSGPLNSATSSFLPAPSHALRSKYSHLPSPIRFVLLAILYLPFSTQFALGLAIAEIVLGSTLWVTGQSRESLAVTGLGYLVVFDGMGGLSGVFVEGGKGVDALWTLLNGLSMEKAIRLPFGTRRLVTLSHFSQAIYLLFSAVYVCKESVEHVLLLHGPAEEGGAHGAGHGGMGHGEAVVSNSSAAFDDGINLPVTLLVLSALLSLISAVFLHTHQTLTQAVGSTSALSFGRTKSRPGNPSLLDRVGNPFTLTILIFSVGLALSAYVIPSVQLAPLDKVVALLQSIAMFYIAYPAAVATGQVLLQTAPPSYAGQMNAFAGGIRDIESHPLVVSVAPPHIWQLTPHPSASATKPPASYRRSASKDKEGSTLIATLAISVKNDASDDDIIQITRFARERCLPALQWGSEQGRGGDDSGRKGGALSAGELTVSVTRSTGGAPVVNFFAHSSTASASNGHDHGAHSSHSHSHGSSHQH